MICLFYEWKIPTSSFDKSTFHMVKPYKFLGSRLKTEKNTYSFQMRDSIEQKACYLRPPQWHCWLFRLMFPIRLETTSRSHQLESYLNKVI